MPSAPKKKARRGVSDRLAGFSWNAKTGVGYFEVYEPGTRLKRRLTVPNVGSRDEAIRLWAQFKAKVKSGAKRVHVVAPTFAEFIDTYFEDVAAQVRSYTARSYRYVVDEHLLAAFGAVRLSEITSGRLNRFSAHLISNGYAGATANNYVNVMHLLLGYAAKWDVIEEVPTKKALDKYAVNEPCNELSADEERSFLAAFDDEEGFQHYLAAHMPRGNVRELRPLAGESARFGTRRVYGAGIRPGSAAAQDYFARFREAKGLFIVALETGLRRGDLLNLAWRSVDLTAGVIELITGKKKRKAVIPISDRCREALDACRRRAVVGGRVFVDREGQPYAIKTIVRYFGIAKAIAGFGSRPFRFHDLRHTYGSKLAREGVNLEYIAKTMAHSNSRITERYARPGSAVLVAVAAALNRAAQRQQCSDTSS
jgi:integrase